MQDPAMPSMRFTSSNTPTQNLNMTNRFIHIEQVTADLRSPLMTMMDPPACSLVEATEQKPAAG